MEQYDFAAYARALDHEALEKLYRNIYTEATIDDPRRQGLFTLRQELGDRIRRVYGERETARVVEEIVSIYANSRWVVRDPVQRIVVDELLGVVIDRHDLSRQSLIIAQDIAGHNLGVAESNRRYITRLLRLYMDGTR